MFDAFNADGVSMEDEFPHLSNAALLTRPVREDLANYSAVLEKTGKSTAAYLKALKQAATDLEELLELLRQPGKEEHNA